MKQSKTRGFTLIELMIVVAIIGVLAVLGIYGVRKYVANAKTAEARAAVGQIAKLAVAAYERESGDSNPLGLASQSTLGQRGICNNAIAVPAAVPKNTKYQSSPADWNSGTYHDGWSCLSFSIEAAQYFQYDYTGVNTSASSGEFSAIARGDLNGDGATSSFTLAGQATGGILRTAPAIAEVSPEE